MSLYLAHRRPFRRAGRALLNAVAVFAVCIIGVRSLEKLRAFARAPRDQRYG